MQLIQPADIEAAIAAYLTAKGLKAQAPPLSRDYTAELPCHLVTRTGGSVRAGVITEHTIELDTYAPTWEQAQDAAAVAWSWLYRTPAEDLHIGDKLLPVYTAAPGMPYSNPDPRHPNTPRVTFSCTVTARAFIVEN